MENSSNNRLWTVGDPNNTPSHQNDTVDLERNVGQPMVNKAKEIPTDIGHAINVVTGLPLTENPELYVKDMGQESRRSWRNYNSLERSLWIALGFVSATAIAFIIGVAVLGIELNKEDETGPITKPPTTTLIPPWLTWAPSTTPTTPRPPRTTTTKPPGWNICSEDECFIAGAKIKESMNTSASACEDFYEFACGGWQKSHPIPDCCTEWNQFSILSESLTTQIQNILQSIVDPNDPPPLTMAQKFYATCTEQGEISDYTELGVFVDGLVNPSETLTLNLAKIKLEVGGNYMFHMYVDLDEMNTNNYTIYIDQPELGIPRQYFIDPLKSNYTQAYMDLIERIWKVVYPTEPNVQDIAKSIVEFESSLAKISTRPEDRQNKTELYNLQTISELFSLTENNIEWDKYFEEVFDDLDIPGFSGPWNDTMVIVRDMNFFEELHTLITIPSQQIIRNFLKWRIIFKLGNNAFPELQKLIFKFSSGSDGLIISQPSLWKTCAEVTNSLFGMAISYQYIQQYFTPEQMDAASEMVDDVKEAFFSTLESPSMGWISEETRSIIEEKIEKMQANIGFPDWLWAGSNETFTVVEYYNDLELKTPEDHFSNVKNVLAWTSRKQLKEINATKDLERWSTVPTIVNAFYSDTYNAMTFPAAIMQVPFFGMPLQYLNYGAMAAIFGHELLHGLDSSGMQNDAHGTLVEWDAGTLENYADKAQCFVTQYNNYTLNGEETLDENIVDSGSINLAFKAYQAYVARNEVEKFIIGLDSFTVDQLFFLSYAQMFCGSDTSTEYEGGAHTPHKFRVKGVVQNSADFAKTWKCEPNKDVEICHLW